MAQETRSSSFTTSPTAAPGNLFGSWPTSESGAQALSYWIDSWQRTWLFWDVMRERGNTFVKHEKEGKPPVLVFDYEMVVDGRTLEDPANDALVRIKPPAAHPTNLKNAHLL